MRDFPSESIGTIVFDAYIANSDRHPRNIAHSSAVGNPELRVFDHSHALLGCKAGDGPARLRRVTGKLVIDGGCGGHMHCLMNALSTEDFFETWIGAVEAIADDRIDAIVAKATQYGKLSDGTAEVLVDFLKNRRLQIRDIMGKALQRTDIFTGLAARRLFP